MNASTLDARVDDFLAQKRIAVAGVSRDNSRHGLSKVDLKGHNAIQGLFVFEA